MKEISYTQAFTILVLNQKPKLNAFKDRRIAACLLISELVELMRSRTVRTTGANRMVVAPVETTNTDYLQPILRDLKGRDPETMVNYVKSAVLSLRKRRVLTFAKAVCDSLIKSGRIEEDDRRYYVTQTMAYRLVTEVYNDLLGDKEPADQTVMLAILLINSDLLKDYYPKAEADKIKDLIEQTSHPDKYLLVSGVIKRINHEVAVIVSAVES